MRRNRGSLRNGSSHGATLICDSMAVRAVNPRSSAVRAAVAGRPRDPRHEIPRDLVGLAHRRIGIAGQCRRERERPRGEREAGEHLTAPPLHQASAKAPVSIDANTAGGGKFRQSSVRRNRVTAMVIATSMRMKSAIASCRRSPIDAPLSMIARVMRR